MQGFHNVLQYLRSGKVLLQRNPFDFNDLALPKHFTKLLSVPAVLPVGRADVFRSLHTV